MESKQPLLHRLGEVGARVGARPPRRRAVRIAIQVTIAFLILGFLLLTVVSQWDELREKGVHFEVGWLVPAFLLLGLTYCISALGWDLILRFLGHRIGIRAAQVAWGKPLLARYVPGSVLYLLARLVYSERAGVPRRITVASIVYEQAISAAGAVAVSTYFFIDHPDLQDDPWRWSVLLFVPLALVVLAPRVFGPLSERVLRAFGRDPLPTLMPLRGVATMIGFYALNWCLIGLGIYFVARSVRHIPLADLPIVGSAQAIGFVATLVTLVAPAGLGVRDAAFAWTVKVALPGRSFALGSLIALAARATLTVVEVLYVGAVSLLDRIYRPLGEPLPVEPEAETEGPSESEGAGGDGS